MSGAGQLQDYSVDQAAGAIVLVLGAISGLLTVLWSSKCHCRVNLCYIFRCERRPPTEEEMKSLKKKADELKNKGKTEGSNPPKDPEAPPTPSPRSPVPAAPAAPDAVGPGEQRTTSPWRRL